MLHIEQPDARKVRLAAQQQRQRLAQQQQQQPQRPECQSACESAGAEVQRQQQVRAQQPPQPHAATHDGALPTSTLSPDSVVSKGQRKAKQAPWRRPPVPMDRDMTAVVRAPQ